MLIIFRTAYLLNISLIAEMYSTIKYPVCTIKSRNCLPNQYTPWKRRKYVYKNQSGTRINHIYRTSNVNTKRGRGRNACVCVGGGRGLEIFTHMHP